MKYNGAAITGTVIIVVIVAIVLIGYGAAKQAPNTVTTTASPSTQASTSVIPAQGTVGSTYLNSTFGLALLDVSYGPTGNQYYAYTATTLAQQTEGYMNATTLGNCKLNSPCIGMLFVFNSYSNLCFWMKSTIIPLKMVWLNQTGTATAIYNATPENTTPVCHDGQFVLETSPSQQMGLGWSVTALEQT